MIPYLINNRLGHRGGRGLESKKETKESERKGRHFKLLDDLSRKVLDMVLQATILNRNRRRL
jgi:hypothetical protein